MNKIVPKFLQISVNREHAQDVPRVKFGPTVWQKLFLYIISMIIVITTNSLYGRLGNNPVLLRTALLLLIIIGIIGIWIKWRLPKRTIGLCVYWALGVAIVYIMIRLLSGKNSGGLNNLFFCLLCITPLFICLLKEANLFNTLLKCFTNVVFLLGITSIALWLAGPIAGIVSVNCTIENTWNGLGVLKSTPGYFGLLFETQLSRFGNYILLRNTSIFTEGPMFSFVLSIALVFELYLSKEIRKPVVLVLVITILTTLTSTGYIFLIGVSILQVIYSMPEKGPKRNLLILALLILVIAGSIAAMWLLNEKLGTSSLSGVTRIDDFVAGYRAWLDSPVYGNGLADSDSILSYMSSFRANNLGFSNSPMAILARGGVIFMLLYLIPFLSFFTASEKGYRISGVLIIYLWTITVVWSLPICILLLSIGLSSALSNANESNHSISDFVTHLEKSNKLKMHDGVNGTIGTIY